MLPALSSNVNAPIGAAAAVPNTEVPGEDQRKHRAPFGNAPALCPGRCWRWDAPAAAGRAHGAIGALVGTTRHLVARKSGRFGVDCERHAAASGLAFRRRACPLVHSTCTIGLSAEPHDFAPSLRSVVNVTIQHHTVVVAVAEQHSQTSRLGLHEGAACHTTVASRAGK